MRSRSKNQKCCRLKAIFEKVKLKVKDYSAVNLNDDDDDVMNDQMKTAILEVALNDTALSSALHI